MGGPRGRSGKKTLGDRESRVTSLLILAKGTNQMKRILALISLVAFIVVPTTYATDMLWDGSASAAWETVDNWTPATVPGGGSPLSRGDDGARINMCQNDGVNFSSSSGDGTYGSRMVGEVFIDGLDPTTTNKKVTLKITGDDLFVDRLIMRGGDTSGEIPFLSVQSTNSLEVERLIINATTSGAQAHIQAQKDFTVRATEVNGQVNFDISAGITVNLGALYLNQGKLDRASLSIPSNCSSA
jgi:hypothetical protein